MDGVPLAAWKDPELSGGTGTSSLCNGGPPGAQLRPGAGVSSADLLKRGGGGLPWWLSG